MDDPIYFANYCYAQNFIVADVRDFPKIKFIVVTGKALYDHFPKGRVMPGGFYKVFPDEQKPVFRREGLESLKSKELRVLRAK